LPSDEEVNWEMVRLQVKLGEITRNRICAEHGITPRRLAMRIKENKWDVDEDATAHDRKIVIEKSLLAIEREIDRLLEPDMSGDAETRAALLGKLTVTMDRLIALDAKVTGKRPTPRQSKEMTELRSKIAKRLDALKVR
jgi:hypothetical protein